MLRSRRRSLAMRYENDTVHVYLLDDENAGTVTGPEKLLDVIGAVHDAYFKAVHRGELLWHFRSGYATSTVTIDETEHPSVAMHISNELIYSTAPGTLSAYRADRFGEFTPHRTETPLPQREATYYMQVTPEDRTFWFTHGANSSANDTDVVYVNSRAFCSLMAEHAPHQLLSPADLQRRIQTGLVRNWSARPQPLLRMSCSRTRERLVFAIAEGNADLLAALQASRAVKFPVAVPKEQADLLRHLCGPAQTGRSPPQGRSPGP